MFIFEKSSKGRTAKAQVPKVTAKLALPQKFLRSRPLFLPEVSELDVIRHYTNLSDKNFSIDRQFYPLGSCTMKYNPRGAQAIASFPGFSQRHPLAPEAASQGILRCLYELQDMLATVTGMAGVSLTPMAGAQGEFAGMAMIKAYHQHRGDHARREIIVPDAAHGTNPATAAMCGFEVREIATAADGDIDLVELKKALGPQTAGIMLTNPSTLGVFERRILEVAELVHAAGGLLYYDGANLNAIVGRVCPGEMGFDVMHMNLHKTFATPHGGGGPGAGPVAFNQRLAPFAPGPIVIKEQNHYRWSGPQDFPLSIGRLSAFMGNAGILLRAYIYARMLGGVGMQRVSGLATLNANYLQARLSQAGFELAYPQRRASHEFIITLRHFKKAYGVSALDVAKRLLDYGIHAPTMYFPLLVPECLLIEPTETESKETLDAFVMAMIQIKQEAETEPELLRQAPHHQSVGRLDEVKAARDLDLVYQEAS